jgi:hypothetical protein
MILAVGGIVAALAYLGPIAIRTTQSWGAYRAEAESEKGMAEMEAQFARDAGRQAEQVRRERRTYEAEQWAKMMEWHRQRESLHRRKSQELLRRWW